MVLTCRCLAVTCHCGTIRSQPQLATKYLRCRPIATTLRGFQVQHRSQSCQPTYSRKTVSVVANSTNSYLSYPFSTAGGGSSSSSAKSSSSMKEWLQYLARKSTNIDTTSVATSMSRILTSLHLDLPKSLPDYSRYIPSAFVIKDPRKWLQQTAEKTTKDISPTKIATIDEKNDHNKRESALSSTDKDGTKMESFNVVNAEPYQREQHDFAKAMNSTRESVETYNGIVTMKETKGEKPLHHVHAVLTLAPKIDKPAVKVEKKSTAMNAITSTYNLSADLLNQISSYLPSVGAKPAAKPNIGDISKTAKPMQNDESIIMKNHQTAVARKRDLVTKSSIDRKTRGLVYCLREAKTNISQLVRLEELCAHLSQYPDSSCTAVKDKVIPCLLRLRSGKDRAIQECSREALALVGYSDPVRRRGIRILTLDGGGTKGLIAIEILKHLESISQMRIHELFDYVCGVSTGSLIAIMMTVFRVPLTETEDLYKAFSSQMFDRNRFLGAGKLFTSHAYYDTSLWEKILKENITEKSFLETMRDMQCPKVSAVSSLVNASPVQNFLFRNYNIPAGRQSHYAGSFQYKLWEAIRASSAAPGYYEECELGDWIHQDGGLLTNNPTAIAIHESRLLWPNEDLQCVVSIGTGRFESSRDPEPVTKSSLKHKVTKIVESATDTLAVHTVLHDLLRPSTYFRFNPYMSENFVLDEIREAKWDQMKQDTEMYCRKNQIQLELAVQRLTEPKPVYKKVTDWVKLQRDRIR